MGRGVENGVERRRVGGGVGGRVGGRGGKKRLSRNVLGQGGRMGSEREESQR